MTTATLKLLTMPECIAAKDATPSPWRDAAVLALNTVWGDDQMRCVLCDELIGRCASYAAIIVPNGAKSGVPVLCRTGGICLPCGVGHTRVEVHQAALFAAVMAMGEVAGSA